MSNPINPTTGEPTKHRATIRNVDRASANTAMIQPTVYSEKVHKDGTVSITGYFDDEDAAAAWKAEHGTATPKGGKEPPEPAEAAPEGE